jgi:hypothetical protein
MRFWFTSWVCSPVRFFSQKRASVIDTGWSYGKSIFKPEWLNSLCLLRHLCSLVMIFGGFIFHTYISYGLSLYIVRVSLCFMRDTFHFVATMASPGLRNPVLRIPKSDDCVSLCTDHLGTRCTPCKYKQDQLVLQCKRKKKQNSLIFK